MVQITSLVGVLALVSTMVHGLPRPIPIPEDSALGVEVGVSAPNGVPLTNSVELSSQLSREAATKTAEAPKVTKHGVNLGSYGSSEMKEEGCKGGECMHSEVTKTAESQSQYTRPAESSHEEPKHEAPKYEEPKHEEPKYTKAAEATKTEEAEAPKYTSPSYGSGKSNWNSNEYEDCVQQCVAKFSSPPGEYKPTATAKEESKPGSGATHTVVVAPSQGVLRYIPFAVNASVGDTVKFMWGANNHTVTKGSGLLPCNATADSPFDTKIQVKDFEFTHEVTDTEPTFFHCTVGVHCQKGMFGIINPPANLVSPDSVSASLQTLATTNSNIMGYMSLTQKNTANNEVASRWGGNIDMAKMPEWSRPLIAENVLYTRNFLAANPEVMKDDGSIDLSTSGSTPLAIPQDVAAALNSAGSGTAASSAPTVAAPAPTTEATEDPAGNASELNETNAAASLSSSKVLAVAIAGVATFFLL